VVWLVSAPFTPTPIVEHFRRRHPKRDDVFTTKSRIHFVFSFMFKFGLLPREV